MLYYCIIHKINTYSHEFIHIFCSFGLLLLINNGTHTVGYIVFNESMDLKKCYK